MIKNREELIELGKTYILDIVKKYVHLKRRGNNHVGLCPFHNEKTPSFSVNEDKGYYKCFGCGQGGDGINFLMEKEGMTFPEALEEIASITNVKVEYANTIDRAEYLDAEKEKQDHKAAQAAQLLHVFNMYYYRGLPFREIRWASRVEDKTVDYLVNIDGRWFSRSTIKTFKLAYARDSSFITKMIDSEKLDRSILLEVGLIKENDKGTYDAFYNRLLFPIYDHLGRLVGFSGRKPSDNTKKENPKYINSPDSLLYNKGKILYGLHVNGKGIQDADHAILVEGYTDVISCYENGIQNVVATCGTAFTAEQAKLLSRYTKRVLIVRDGDEAGLKAAKKDVVIAVAAGLQAEVCLLPEGEDPDSLVRKKGAGAFWDILDKEKQDGVIWRVMLDWDPKDTFKKEAAVMLAADLLSSMKSEFAQQDYLRKLSDKQYLADVSKLLKDAVNKKNDDKVRKGKAKLSPAQQYDALNYGVYEAHNKYWICRDLQEGTGWEISNFVINPIMLIRAREEQRRLIEIQNEHKQSHIIEVDTRVFASFDRFSDYIEGLGNFLYNEWAKKAHHIKIKRKVYAVTPTCYPIYTMGLHKEGFYTWGNGIISSAGKFLPVDEYGLVTHEDTKYFLKAHSKIDLSIKSDDTENMMEDQINFYYNNGVGCPSIKDTTKLMHQVHGDNAMIALAWLFAALFRDMIYKRFNFFPHLNHFGPPSAGKSFLAWSLGYFFGAKPKAPFHLVHGTDAAFFRTLSWVRNGMAWFDEYKDDIDFKRVEALKAAYDGAGREKAKGAYGNNVTRTPVNSAVLITGQEQPLQDPALFTRCITLSFPKKDLTTEQIKRADNLKAIQETGLLPQIITRILKHRAYVEEKFIHVFDNIRSLFRKNLVNEDVVQNDRVIQNYAIILAIFTIIAKKEEMGFEFGQLMEFAYKNMLEQFDSMSTQDEVGTFWQIVDYLLADNQIRHSKDILVEYRKSEKFRDESDRSNRKDNTLVTFEEETKLIYLNFTRIHPLYQERMQRSKRNNGLAIEALKYYLRGMEGFVGEKRAKKFDGKTRSCYVFRASEINIDFQTSKVALTHEVRVDDEEE